MLQHEKIEKNNEARESICWP